MKKFLAVIMMLLGLGVTACDVKDPSDSRYNPDKFSFNDFKTDREAKIEYFRKLFPVGTPKDFVDRVLVKAGGASVLEVKEIPENWIAWRYQEPPIPGYPGGPVYIAFFDQSQRLANFVFSPAPYLYGEEVTLRKLREEYNTLRRK